MPELAWEALLDVDGAGPLTVRLVATLRRAVAEGRLPPGASLLPSRELASRLGCSRWVVTEAYSTLVAEGLLEARRGSATRVSSFAQAAGPTAPAPPAAGRGPLLDLAPGVPDLRAFPRERWAQSVRAVLPTISNEDLFPVDVAGNPSARGVVGAHLTRSRAVDLTVADVVLTSGTRDGLARMCRALRASGHRRIGLEDPGWPALAACASSAGLTPVSVPVDEEGLVVDTLRGDETLRAVVVGAAHQFPTGAVLTAERRAALLEWARAVDGVVLEDDYDAEFVHQGAATRVLQGEDPTRVVLLGTTSKTLAPGVALGWMILPQVWTERVRSASEGSLAPSALTQAAFAHLLTSGGYDRHLRAARRRYRARRDALVELARAGLPWWAFTGGEVGLHVMAMPPSGTRADMRRLVAAARASGLALTELGEYQAEPDEGTGALVLGYGALRDGALGEVVQRLVQSARAAGLSGVAPLIGLEGPPRIGP